MSLPLISELMRWSTEFQANEGYIVKGMKFDR